MDQVSNTNYSSIDLSKIYKGKYLYPDSLGALLEGYTRYGINSQIDPEDKRWKDSTNYFDVHTVYPGYQLANKPNIFPANGFDGPQLITEEYYSKMLDDASKRASKFKSTLDISDLHKGWLDVDHKGLQPHFGNPRYWKNGSPHIWDGKPLYPGGGRGTRCLDMTTLIRTPAGPTGLVAFILI